MLRRVRNLIWSLKRMGSKMAWIIAPEHSGVGMLAGMVLQMLSATQSMWGQGRGSSARSPLLGRRGFETEFVVLEDAKFVQVAAIEHEGNGDCEKSSIVAIQ